MKIKNDVKNQTYLVCNCCGESFKMEETIPEVLFDHQKNNKECTGYFNINLKGGKRK